MDVPWKVTDFFLGLLLIGLSSGFPIGLENSAADYHTQLLTGLVGVLLTICGVVFLGGCLCCARRNGFKDDKTQEFQNSAVVASTASSLDHGLVNPIANGEFTIFTPLSPTHHNNNVFLANEQVIGTTEISHSETTSQLWFDETEKDFPRTKLKYIKEIGKGWFGRVVQGTAEGLNNKDSKDKWTTVIVRILEASASSSERAMFLNDANIYLCGQHPHVLQLLGRCLESVPLLLLQEFSYYGDLKKYLRNNTSNAEKLLFSDLPLRWSCQLTSALKHLHEFGVAHPDLAARNCQIVTDLNLKLGDYGLAVSSYPEDYYQGTPAVPVRWCAPESLTCTSTTIQPKQFTFESNIWSFGVTIWEIYSCGLQPYSSFSDDDVILQVLGAANVRLQRPNYSLLYSDYIYRIMQLCWSTCESRPTISQVHLMLTDLFEVYKNTKNETHQEPQMSLEDFDKRWDSFKPNSVIKTDNHQFDTLSENRGNELMNQKLMSPSLNNLHGSLDNLNSGEMDSWLQKVATRTGDMSYVRGLSEAIQDLDNTLALENVSSSDSSHQPSPAPESILATKQKLDFKLGTSNENSNFIGVPNSLTESMQHTSSGSETEDENWRKKIELGVYSEKVHQKSKSVADLMILTHIDCSESESETPLPSLDYRINYKNVRYLPKQNLENSSLMFGSEGNLLSVHDKFQEELKKLKEERQDSLLFVPEYNNDTKVSDSHINESSSYEENCVANENDIPLCTFVNTNPSKETPNEAVILSHHSPEKLIEELSSPTEIQPANQIYNVFNVTVDANFSPVKYNFNNVVCLNEEEQQCSIKTNEQESEYFKVPKLSDLIQNNNGLMDYIIAKYESQEENVKDKTDVLETLNLELESTNKEPNNNEQCNATTETSTNVEFPITNIRQATKDFLLAEQNNYKLSLVHFDVSLNQEEVLPSSMTHAALFTSTPHIKRTFDFDINGESKSTQFSSNFSADDEVSKMELNYSLETWDNFLGKSFDVSREFSSEPQSLLFSVNDTVVNSKKDEEGESDNEEVGAKSLEMDLNDDLVHVESSSPVNVNSEIDGSFINLNDGLNNTECLSQANLNNTVVLLKDVNNTYVCDDGNKTYKCEDDEPSISEDSNKTYICTENNETYICEDEEIVSSSNKWEQGDGWFLHPQTNSELDGEIDISQNDDPETYSRFGIDDEIMTAIRNELLLKLPQAQGQASEQVRDSDDWNSEGRSEVHIRYNLYTTPLSPIPEESYSENSKNFICNRDDSSDSENCDWPEPYEEHKSSTEIHENPIEEQQNRHTPSQDSCCSNDTLFNLEELSCAVSEGDSVKNILKYGCEVVSENQQLNKTFVKESETNLKDRESKNDANKKINKTFSTEDEPNLNENMNNCNSTIIIERTSSNDEDELNKTFNIEEKLSVKDDEKIHSTEDELNLNENTNNCNSTIIIERTSSNDEDELNKTYNVEEKLSVKDGEKIHSIKMGNENLEISDINMEYNNKNLKQNHIEESNQNLNVGDNGHLQEVKVDRDECISSEEVVLIKLLLNDMINTIVKENNGCNQVSVSTVQVLEQTAKSECEEEDKNDSNDSDLQIDIGKSNGSDEQSSDNFEGIEKVDLNEKNECASENNTNSNNILIINNESNSNLQDNKQNDVTLLVENNPNYITEFLNNERENNLTTFSCASNGIGNSLGSDNITEYTNAENDYVNCRENNGDNSFEADYVNSVKHESDSNEVDYVNTLVDNDQVHYVNSNQIEEENDELYDFVNSNCEGDMYDALTDIRFNGPCDIQLMSTSFSESVDIDEQDWDSGSDTRSSSSGEFIWKEGEHEESVKALRAAPQENDVEKSNKVEEADEISTDSSDDDEGDSPEFVPSAWDKYATPTKSALRSPEKTLEKSEEKHKKTKGVWFKKQKYHCVYEYPREPESPSVNIYDLWQPLSASMMDWRVDTSYSINQNTENTTGSLYQPNQNLYHLPELKSGMTRLDDEFYISSSTRPFQTLSEGGSSQFFPGQSISDQWTNFTKRSNENITPDSGVEDITPAGTNESLLQIASSSYVHPLKVLAAAVLKRNQISEIKSNNKDSPLGGLRHARNKLKLDLPPSPSAFTSSKSFVIDSPVEPITKREVPAFTTFGKSRFLVQHVDTPTLDDEKSKNVSFEALPYKPRIMAVKKDKVEVVRGEASLLDSADEDSGIESSTLERHKITNLSN